MDKFQMRQSLLLLLTATIWGVAFVAQSVGMDYVGPLTFNCVRSLLGGAVLLPCIWLLDKYGGKHGPIGEEGRIGHEGKNGGQAEGRLQIGHEGKNGGQAEGRLQIGHEGKNGKQADRQLQIGHEGKKRKQADRQLLAGGIICGLLLCLATNFQQVGIAYTTVGKAGFITALYIVIVPVLGLFSHRKCRPLLWLGVFLALVGLYFLCMAGAGAQVTEGQVFPGIPIGKGDFLVFICALLFSGHILAIDHFTQRVDGVKMSCIQFWVCGLVSGVGMFLAEEPRLAEILMAWKPLLYAGVMSCGVAYTLQVVGQKGMDPTVASLILSLESVISVLAGLVVLGQRLSWQETLGCALMFAAIVLAQVAGKEKSA